MCNETAKAHKRRIKEGWFELLKGEGIDIGCGYDKLTVPYGNVRGWDTGDGDAQFMASVADETYDFVYSSHCLEHMVDPREALRNWWRILKPGGYLAVIVPDEDLYEQGVWPSKGNGDHKSTWYINKEKSWSAVGYNLETEIRALLYADVKIVQRVDTNYDYELAKRGWIDQTGGDVEAACECVAYKMTEKEVSSLLDEFYSAYPAFKQYEELKRRFQHILRHPQGV